MTPLNAPGSDVKLSFDAPKQWQQGPASGMRKAAFAVADANQKAEITVIDLEPAAAALLPNVNRWRDQVGLKEVNQAELDKSLQPVFDPWPFLAGLWELKALSEEVVLAPPGFRTAGILLIQALEDRSGDEDAENWQQRGVVPQVVVDAGMHVLSGDALGDFLQDHARIDFGTSREVL